MPGMSGPAETGPTQAKAALGAILKGRTRGNSSPGSATRPPPDGPRSELPGLSLTAEPIGVTSSASAGAPLPTRDTLTKAWGDTVLAKLTRSAQVYMGGGRFTEVADGAAVFALPDRGILQRASNFTAEAESALAAYFGQRVPLRLVVDPGATPPPLPGGEGTYDLDDLKELTEAPEVRTMPLEERILEAFPGSVLDE